MNTAPDAPRQLAHQWAALLLAPTAWAGALGILFALTRDACVQDERAPLWVVISICIVLALVSGALAWRGRVYRDENRAVDRAHFMRCVALGLSAMFSIVLILMVVPILLLGACRT